MHKSSYIKALPSYLLLILLPCIFGLFLYFLIINIDKKHEIEAIKSHSSTVFEKNIAQDKINWLKSIKDRVGCEVNCTTTKEWSEEDKEMLNDIIVDVEVLKEQDRTKDGKEIYQKEIDWLKSLKFQNYWKPNEKQIMSLYNSIPNAAFCERETLTQLYVDLKKLTE